MRLYPEKAMCLHSHWYQRQLLCSSMDCSYLSISRLAGAFSITLRLSGGKHTSITPLTAYWGIISINYLCLNPSMHISPQGHAQLSLSTSQSLFVTLITMKISSGMGWFRGGLIMTNWILIALKLVICLHFLYQASF